MHYTEDELILYYYGEHRRRDRVEQHLAGCVPCRESFQSLAAALALVSDPEVPARGDQYGLEVWQRIRHQLPEQEAPWWAVWTRPGRLALAGAAAVLVIAAFVAGRTWPGSSAPVQPTVAVAPPAGIGADAGERVRLAAVGDHLEQSERVLLEFVNAYGTADQPADVRVPQQSAADLISANRLYRDASTAAGGAGGTGGTGTGCAAATCPPSTTEQTNTPASILVISFSWQLGRRARARAVLRRAHGP